MKEIVLNPHTVSTIAQRTGMSPAELDAMYMIAKDRGEEHVFKFTFTREKRKRHDVSPNLKS